MDKHIFSNSLFAEIRSVSLSGHVDFTVQHFGSGDMVDKDSACRVAGMDLEAPKSGSFQDERAGNTTSARLLVVDGTDHVKSIATVSTNLHKQNPEYAVVSSF